MIQVRRFTYNLLQENSYIVWDDSLSAVLVDPSFYTEADRDGFFSFISGKNLKPSAILLTHGHFDHLFGVAQAASEFGIPVWMGPEDARLLRYGERMAVMMGMRAPDTGFPRNDARDSDVVRAGAMSFKAIATPGHSPGGICWYDAQDGVMFTGDTLFAGTIGRSDLEGGDYDKLIVSVMEKLMGLPGETQVYPGHGPASTISNERTSNPFLEPFNEPEETQEL